jgi:hypothetical protein
MGTLFFTQSLDLTLFDMRPEQYGGKLINFMRQVQANNALAYNVSRTQEDPITMQLIGYANWQAKLAALSPSLSQPLLLNETLSLNIDPASNRMDEIWRVVTGTSEFSGTDENADSILGNAGKGNLGGLETKIRDFGTYEVQLTESHTAAGGVVQTSHPIYDSSVISAWKAGNVPLTVHSIVNANLGQVSLYDGGVPVANIPVTISYGALRNTVYFLTESLQVPYGQLEQTDAVMVSQALMTYLANNS